MGMLLTAGVRVAPEGVVDVSKQAIHCLVTGEV
jgi:hypothetical protein